MEILPKLNGPTCALSLSHTRAHTHTHTHTHTHKRFPWVWCSFPWGSNHLSAGPSVNLHCVYVHKKLFFLSVSNNDVAFKKKKKNSEGLSSAESTVCFSSVGGLWIIILRLRKCSFVAPVGTSSRTNVVQGWKTNLTIGSSANTQVRFKGKTLEYYLWSCSI